MSRYYDEPIHMECAAIVVGGAPVRFMWRERPYRVLAVLARWHVRDRWWAAETTDVERAASGSHRADVATDRFYWRLHCASPSTPMVFCVVYHDAAASTAKSWSWRLERVYD